MAPFLPVIAISRSQNIRIGGAPGLKVVNQLGNPQFRSASSAIIVSTTSGSTTVTVTTGNTQLLRSTEAVSGPGIPAGATVASVTDDTHFVLSAAATATATGVTLQTAQPVVPFYVDLNDGQSRRDLAHHSALGAIISVGPLTNNSSDFIVLSGGTVTAGAGLTVNVAAGVLEQRSLDARAPGAAATNLALASSAIGGGNERTDLVAWNGQGVAVVVSGVVAATGASVAPATPANYTPLATVLVPTGAVAPGTITSVAPTA